ncbi:unnamed protein product [Cylindrotheca closterium]|uniref:PDZ domain-containing protein n=1 Tax=Cylindrotheca closterium TaxID=2856 RepID=A0AAD2FMX5_9STRA|nr:unnamed protein product [Cylindrotheca closterium]
MSCLAPYDGNETFVQRNYDHNGWTNYLHNHAPRFGYTNNVMHWLKGTESQQSAYIKGLQSSVVAMSVLFVLWIGALVFFRIRGPSYFGWLSGRRRELPAEPNVKGVPPMDEDEMHLLEHSMVTVDAIKTRKQKLGLSLGKTREGAIVVYDIDEKGLFYGSDIQVGHRIAAVNDQRCTGDLKRTIQMLRECEGPFTIKVHHEICEEDLAIIEWDAVFDKTVKHQKIFRHIIFVALVVIISMGIVLSADGVQALSKVVDQGVKTFNKIEERAQYGLDLLDDIQFSVTNVKKDGHFLLDAVNKVCPKKTEKICSDLKDPSSCQEDLGLPFVPELQKAISYINHETGIQENIKDARNELDFLISHTFGLSADLEKIHTLLWALMVMSIALSFLCVIIVAGVGFGRPEIVGFFRRSCVFPLFGIMVFFSFALSVSFLMMSLVAADTCYDDPGPKVAAMVESSYTGGSSELMEDIMLRVFEGCQVPSIPLQENVEQLRDDILFFEQFSSNLEVFEPDRINTCGASPWTFSKLDLAINNRVNEHLCTASDHLRDFGDFFTCRFWYPIYFKAVHESICTDGTEGLAVIATTQIIVVFMALLVLTYRAALWDVKVSTVPNNSKKTLVKSAKPPTSEGTLMTATSRLTDDSSSDADSGEDRSPSNKPMVIAIDNMEQHSRESQPLAMPSIDYPDEEEKKEDSPESNPLLVSKDVVLEQSTSHRSIVINETAKEAPSSTPMIGMAVLESIELDHDGNSTVSSVDPPTFKRQSSNASSKQCNVVSENKEDPTLLLLRNQGTSIKSMSELSATQDADESIDSDSIYLSSDIGNASITFPDLLRPGHLVAEDRMKSINEDGVISDSDIKFVAADAENCSVEQSLDDSKVSLHSLSSVNTKPVHFSGINVSTRSMLSSRDIEKSKRPTLESNDSRRSIHSAPSIMERKSSVSSQDECCDESITPVLVETKARGRLRRGTSITVLQSNSDHGLTKQNSSAAMTVDSARMGDMEAGDLPPLTLRAPQPPVDMDDYNDVGQQPAPTPPPVDMDDYDDMAQDAPHDEEDTISPSQILALERKSEPKQLIAELAFDEIPMNRAYTSVYSNIDSVISDAEALMGEKKDRVSKQLTRGDSFSNQSAPGAPLSRPAGIQTKQVSVSMSEGGAGDIEVQDFMF